jgi:hypothetical protein|tara:strand:- start:1167 stop:1439 length:273 start_codon:yes stop_codon:yes gene_type:complete
MAYIQQKNPIKVTGCGRRRSKIAGNGMTMKEDKQGIVKVDAGPLTKKGTKDACYHKVKSRVKVWPSAYASGQLVQCRKAGAANWGTKSKK